MSVPAPYQAKRLLAPFPAMVVYTLRQVVGGRRWLPLLAVVGAAGVGFGLLSHQLDDPSDEAFAFIVESALFGVVVPLACLVVGDAVLGSEIRGGTFPLTWLSPVSVASIVVARWLAGWLLAGTLLAGACALSAVMAGSPENADAAAGAAAAAAGAYIALFVFLGAVTRRAAVRGLVMIYLIEQLLGGVLAGVAQLSPQWLGRGVYAAYGENAGDLVRSGVPNGASAMIRLAIIAIVVLGFAIWRLRNLRLTGGRVLNRVAEAHRARFS